MARLTDWYVPLIGRIFVGGFFLWSGILNTLNFSLVSASLASSVPEPLYVAFFIIAIEVLGGIALIIGWQQRAASLVLAIYLLGATLFFHSNFNDPTQTELFLENFAIVGGLLYISAYSSRDWSI